MSVVRLIVATPSSGPPASCNIIKEMPGSVASGTHYIFKILHNLQNLEVTLLLNDIQICTHR